MTWLRAATLALIVLLCWTSIAFLSTGWHEFVFAIVPIDEPGPVHSIPDWGRENFDVAVTRYFVSGKASELGGPAAEVAHMADVRQVWLGITMLSLIGLAWVGTVKPFDVLRQSSLIVGGIGLLTLLGFEPLFLLLHQLLFPHGNWEFSAQSLLVEVYPAAFFVWMWGTIVAASAVSLVVVGHHRRRKRT